MGAHRVISLVREVPDLRLTRAFYTEFGLRETSPGRFATEVGGEQLVLRAGDAPRVVEPLGELDWRRRAGKPGRRAL